MKYIVCIFWRNKDTIFVESDWANQINTKDQKNMLSEHIPTHFPLRVQPPTAIFHRNFLLRKKRARDRMGVLSLARFSQNKVWGITNIKYRSLHYEMNEVKSSPDI